MESVLFLHPSNFYSNKNKFNVYYFYFYFFVLKILTQRELAPEHIHGPHTYGLHKLGEKI